MELGEQIRWRRERLGLTKTELSRLVGCSDVAVHYWERGDIKEIGHWKLLALAQALECSVSELLEDPALERPTQKARADVAEQLGVFLGSERDGQGMVSVRAVEAWLDAWRRGDAASEPQGKGEEDAKHS